MELTDEDVLKASERGARQRARWSHATKVRYNRHTRRVVISLASGVEVSFSPKDAQGFEGATEADLTDSVITPSGLGVLFPRINADIYIPGLLQGTLGSKPWMEAIREDA